MKPIYMAKFMLDYEILVYFTKVFFQIFDPSQTVNTKAITAKMVEKFGDLKIVKRSTRAFLKTLTDFNLIEKVTQDSFHQLPKQELSENQVKDILNLYSICNHTKQINLQTINSTLFAWYKKPDLEKVAHKFHPKEWVFVAGIDRSLILLKLNVILMKR